MAMKPRLSKFVLTTHVTFSLGWFGAIAAYLAMALAGLISRDPQVVGGAYLMMRLTGWLVILPAAMGALLTGIIQGLGTKWGLFRHYWVLFKLALTVVATFLLLLHLQRTSLLAGVAAGQTVSTADYLGPRVQLVADAAYALGALLVATVLAVYKPRGMTRYGQRKQRREQLAKKRVVPEGQEVSRALG
jgi:hypothetical protein